MRVVTERQVASLRGAAREASLAEHQSGGGRRAPSGRRRAAMPCSLEQHDHPPGDARPRRTRRRRHLQPPIRHPAAIGEPRSGRSCPRARRRSGGTDRDPSRPRPLTTRWPAGDLRFPDPLPTAAGGQLGGQSIRSWRRLPCKVPAGQDVVGRVRGERRSWRWPVLSRRATALGILVPVGAALAACSVSASLPSHPFSGAASTTSMTATTVTRSSAAPAAATCQATQLLLRLPTNFLEASGQFEQPVIVENHSQTPCELGGWPALAVIDPAGRPISTTNAFLGRYNPSLPEWPTVLLEPGGRASFAVMGEDYNTVDDRTCPQSSSWRVDLPSVARPIEVSARRPACEGSKGITFEVTPLLPGLSMKRFQDFSQFTGSATCDERCSPSS